MTTVFIVRQGARLLNAQARVIYYCNRESAYLAHSVKFCFACGRLCAQVRRVAHDCVQKRAASGEPAGLRDARSAMRGGGLERCFAACVQSDVERNAKLFLNVG